MGRSLVAKLPAPFWGFVLTVGLLLSAVGLREAWAAAATQHWPTAPGRITDFTADGPHRSSYGTDYFVHVSYDYTVGGTARESEGVTLDDSGRVNADEYEALRRRYPVGQAVTVHYDPADAGRTVLESTVSKSDTAPLFLGVIWSLAGLAGLVFTVVWQGWLARKLSPEARTGGMGDEASSREGES